MKEYDFSGISTEQLKIAIKRYQDKKDSACVGLNCPHCPLVGMVCDASTKVFRHKLFKAELKRREQVENNKMPALEAGMVVELYNSEDETDMGLFLYINNDWCLDIHDSCTWQDIEDGVEVIKVYKSKNKGSFTSIKEKLELLWELKEDNSDKIKELEKTVKDAQELINNAIEQIKELQG